MAGHEVENPTGVHETGQNSLTLSMSLIAGGGVVLMITALAIGVINGQSSLIGILFIGGLLAFIAGTAAWFGLVQPHKNFDDINRPLYHGEHHDDHAVAEHPEQPGEVHVTEPDHQPTIHGSHH
ncbi:MAG: hypothetical protein MUF87_14985 [Anaerolineae bacterium]|jgi:hypothetical protein|nr:hypothetical protein [Anaerolineae bacterium]